MNKTDPYILLRFKPLTIGGTAGAGLDPSTVNALHLSVHVDGTFPTARWREMPCKCQQMP